MLGSSSSSLLILSSLLSLLLPTTSNALTTDEWRERSIYQVVTDRFARPANATATCNTSDKKYCGGTYQALIEKLPYIKGMGFDAIWISPIVENIGATASAGEAYHGYWSLDISKTNDHFGSADDLKALASALHSMGMYLMVDIVVNHVAATSSSTFKTSSAYGPFDVQSDFHPFCWIDPAYTNQTNIEQCWLGDTNVALADLNTEDSTVVSYFNNWIKQLVSDYSIDGLRIDTVKHVRKDFWPEFVSSAGVFAMGEVLDGSVGYNAPYQQESMPSVLNYPAYYQVGYAFEATTGSMATLAEVHNNISTGFKDPTVLGNFLDNHDQPRFASRTSDIRLNQNALTYPFVTSGIPILYYGQEQGFSGGADPANREPMWTSGYSTSGEGYTYVKMLNDIRHAAFNASSAFYTTKSTVANTTDHEIVIAKGPLISILTNRGSSGESGSVQVPASAGLPQVGQVVDVLTCTSWQTDSHGASLVTITGGAPQLIMAKAEIGSLCPNGVTASTTTSGSTDTTPAGGNSSSGSGQESAGSRRVMSKKSTVLGGLVGFGTWWFVSA